MSYYCYDQIGNFGSNSNIQSNPVSYCFTSALDSSFAHGGVGGNGYMGADNKQCQIFMGAYCADEWNGVCEYASRNIQTGGVVNFLAPCNGMQGGTEVTKGDVLVRNTASEKYLQKMSSNCQRVYEPFDPTTAGSPLISTWKPASEGCGSGNCPSTNSCIPIYGVDPKTVDADPVMNKILAKPQIAMDILINMYTNMVKIGSLHLLRGTKLYQYFSSATFQNIVNSKLYNVGI
jgi:hypothetical protein